MLPLFRAVMNLCITNRLFKFGSTENSVHNIVSNLALEVLPPQKKMVTENQKIVDSLKDCLRNGGSGRHKGTLLEDTRR